MTKMCNKWKRVYPGDDMYYMFLNECPFCGLQLIETYNFEKTYIYCPKCGKKIIDKESEDGNDD
jgi:uncharacterized Zn finger protein (UPF0148 family)